MPKRMIENADAIMVVAMEDYKKPELTTDEIAVKYGVSTSTLTVWAKKCGLKLRKRGRRCQTTPTPWQLEIVRLALTYKYDQVGARFGMHKQSIHRIVKRWKNWASPKQSPFEPGDILSWNGKKLTVIDAAFDSGTLIDEKKRIYKGFIWNAGRIPSKIGVNPTPVKKLLEQALAVKS